LVEEANSRRRSVPSSSANAAAAAARPPADLAGAAAAAIPEPEGTSSIFADGPAKRLRDSDLPTGPGEPDAPPRKRQRRVAFRNWYGPVPVEDSEEEKDGEEEEVGDNAQAPEVGMEDGSEVPGASPNLEGGGPWDDWDLLEEGNARPEAQNLIDSLAAPKGTRPVGMEDPLILRFHENTPHALELTAKLCPGASKILGSLADPDFKTMNDRARAKLLGSGTPRQALMPTRKMFASVLTHTSRIRRSFVEQVVAQFCEEGWAAWQHYIDGQQYDESKFEVTLRAIAAATSSTANPLPVAAARISDRTEDALEPALSFELEPIKGRRSGSGRYDPVLRKSKKGLPARLFQTRSQYGILIKLTTEDLPEDKRHIFWEGATLNWVQAVERTNGECEREALMGTLAITSSSKQAGKKTRLLQVDRASGGHRAERGIMVDLKDSRAHDVTAH